MLAASSIMMSLRWREFASYGIASPKWRSGVNLGLAFSLLMLLAGAFQWDAPHFLVHDKREIVQLIERLQCSQLITRWLLPTPFLSQAALNSFGVA
jgi:hypothetical protein